MAINRSTGAYIAIQCKSRQLDDHGRGNDIERPEITSFISESEKRAVRPKVADYQRRQPALTTGLSARTPSSTRRLSFSTFTPTSRHRRKEISETRSAPTASPAPMESGASSPRPVCRNDAVSIAVSRLRGQLETDLDSIPSGQARGKIILPCGTGKTRISLRIVEETVAAGRAGSGSVPFHRAGGADPARIPAELRKAHPGPGGLLRRDGWLRPKKEGQRNTFEEVTADSSNVSADEIKGKVTTNPSEIARWIRDGQEYERVSVIFGTYQSGHRIAEGLRTSGTTAEVLICDEAHRTAGLRRTRKSTVDQIKDFTLCHDNDKFPAKHRIYQTATPKIYTQKALRRNRKKTG